MYRRMAIKETAFCVCHDHKLYASSAKHNSLRTDLTFRPFWQLFEIGYFVRLMTLALLSLIYFYLDLLLVLLIVVQIWTLEDLLMTLALPYLVILGNVNVISELDKNIFVET